MTKRSSGSVYCSAAFSSIVWFIALGNGIVGDDFTRCFITLVRFLYSALVRSLFLKNGIRDVAQAA